MHTKCSHPAAELPAEERKQLFLISYQCSFWAASREKMPWAEMLILQFP